MTPTDEQVERVARAIYDAEPTIRVEVRVPRTTADFTSSLEIRNVPWSALDECEPHEKSAMVTSRNLARAAIAALQPQDGLAELRALVDARDAISDEMCEGDQWMDYASWEERHKARLDQATERVADEAAKIVARLPAPPAAEIERTKEGG